MPHDDELDLVISVTMILAPWPMSARRRILAYVQSRLPNWPEPPYRNRRRRPHDLDIKREVDEMQRIFRLLAHKSPDQRRAIFHYVSGYCGELPEGPINPADHRIVSIDYPQLPKLPPSHELRVVA